MWGECTEKGCKACEEKEKNVSLHNEQDENILFANQTKLFHMNKNNKYNNNINNNNKSSSNNNNINNNNNNNNNNIRLKECQINFT